MGVVGVVTDVIFAVFTIVLMTFMKIPSKGSLKTVFHNITFWIYIAFWAKTLINLIRIPVIYTNSWDPVYWTLWFNWSGNFIATLSSVVPVHFLYHHHVHGRFSQISMTDRLHVCLLVAVAYAVAIIACSVAISTKSTSAENVLFGWRIFFLLNATIECSMLFWCIRLIDEDEKKKRRSSDPNIRSPSSMALVRMGSLANRIPTDVPPNILNSRPSTASDFDEIVLDSTKRQPSNSDILRRPDIRGLPRKHLWVTLYIRVGISIILVLKMTEKFPKVIMLIFHLFFVASGLFLYYLRTRGNPGTTFWNPTPNLRRRLSSGNEDQLSRPSFLEKKWSQAELKKSTSAVFVFATEDHAYHLGIHRDSIRIIPPDDSDVSSTGDPHKLSEFPERSFRSHINVATPRHSPRDVYFKRSLMTNVSTEGSTELDEPDDISEDSRTPSSSPQAPIFVNIPIARSSSFRPPPPKREAMRHVMVRSSSESAAHEF